MEAARCSAALVVKAVRMKECMTKRGVRYRETKLVSTAVLLPHVANLLVDVPFCWILPAVICPANAERSSRRIESIRPAESESRIFYRTYFFY